MIAGLSLFAGLTLFALRLGIHNTGNYEKLRDGNRSSWMLRVIPTVAIKKAVESQAGKASFKCLLCVLFVLFRGILGLF